MTYSNYDALGLVRPSNSSVLVDQLGAAYTRMKVAEAEYASLRAIVLETGERNGDFYNITVSDVSKRHLDIEALEARFGKPAVEECCEYRTTTYVRVRKAA